MIDICLAVYNNLFWTKRFIDSLYKSTYSDFNLYITDNGSSDDTYLWLKSLSYNNINIIKNEINLGCAKGWNLSLKKAQSEIIVLTQNDIQFSKNWDKYLLSFLEENPEFSAVGSQEIENLDISQEDFDKLVESFKINSVKYNSFYIPCVMIKKEVFKKIGYFDENFIGGFYEDQDFIRRCAIAKIKYAQVLDSIVCHCYGRTSRYHAQIDINKKYFLEKWENWDDSEIKDYLIYYNDDKLSYLYNGMGKIKREFIKKELEKNNIKEKYIV